MEKKQEKIRKLCKKKEVIVKIWRKNRERKSKVNKTLAYYVHVTQKYQKAVTKRLTL